jgi:cytochrome P450
VTSERATVDFDHYSKEFATAPRETWDSMMSKCPVAWSDHHGGFWVISDYDGVSTVSRDVETYASRNDQDPESIYRGVAIPNGSVRFVPVETDPPEFYGYRRLLTPFFSPGSVERRKPRIQEIADALIDQVIESGQIDLVEDFAGVLPAILTLELLGIPISEWQKYARPMHAFIYTPSDAPERDQVVQEFLGITTALVDVIEQRKKEREDDFVSFLIDAKIDGQLLGDEMILGICMVVVGGGVDTTTAATSQALNYLSQNPIARQRLIDEPELMASANEEFLRFFTPVQTIGRTASRDVELKGQHISRGDRVMIAWAGANQDESEFPRPHDLQLDRSPNRHSAFGLGIHRCIGSSLARTQMSIMIRTVLDRLPDYVVDTEAARPYTSIGQINGWISIPAAFTPGKQLNTGSI